MKNKKIILVVVIISLTILAIGINIIINSVEKVEKDYSVEKVEKGYEVLGNEFCDGERGHPFWAGEAITSWKCKICGYSDSYPNTATPTICGECAHITGRCTKCGRIKK